VALDGEIVGVSMDGGAPTVLATSDSPEEITIDATSVYWTSTGSSIVGRVWPLSGGDAEGADASDAGASGSDAGD
jgi:hypothetical protein